ncbi:MAG: SAM-dependent methyltransferase [Phycisphaerae bacterium]|nr:SAM-dependent methyltransferase [Saprospiraceae bacterium]
MSTLYLIPCPIAENALHTVAPYAQVIARQLDIFIVERAKTARHFIKSLTPSRPIQEMVFVELPPHPQPLPFGEGSNEAEQVFREAIKAGKNVGLLSEAGCPGVADPGASIVALAHREGVKVVPLVGPSSILLALMASGMNGQRFSFHGYLPPKRPELAKELRRLENLSRQHDQTQIFIETPYRSQMVLEVALESLQPTTLFGVAQDLTGEAEFICTLSVKDWNKSGRKTLEKLPGVFLVYCGNKEFFKPIGH